MLQVSGLRGAGCTTLTAALTARFGVVAIDGGGREGDPVPDLHIRVIGAQARARDRVAIDGASIPVIVVAGKSDARTRMLSLADTAARDLGRPVLPVSGLLAAAHLTPDDVVLLRGWEQSGVTVPTAAAAFSDGDCSQRERARMMALLGRAGLTAVFGHLATMPTATADDLTTMLRTLSGIDALIAPITGAADRIAQGRRVRRLSALRLLAARGPNRAAAERRLIAESVR